MREIKIRLVYKELNGNYYFEYKSVDALMNGDFHGGRYKIRTPLKLVEQDRFTGLKDKNGKEIYESDIVKYNIGNEEDNDIGKVNFYRGSWSVAGVQIYNPYVELEVIGNIYENPELQEEKI